ncbi:hypothetical protein R1flu_008335 [Riccia fluitans]|uniref:Uncharacterized protein n=1 Tax=Riccia fluitans TaxID=41844 RepID=A0ABD1YBM2_9MARC
MDLTTVYTSNESIKGRIRQLMALGFLPVPRIREGLQAIIDSLSNAEYDILESLFQYFVSWWCERIPLSMWNLHGIQRRTNNNCEDWHNKFNWKVNRHHPDIWRLISALQSEQANSSR